MRKKIWLCCFLLLMGFICMTPGWSAFAGDPIVIGVSTSLGYLEGRESLEAVQMAVDEINAAGGVKWAVKNIRLQL